VRAAILESVPGDLVIDDVTLMDIGPDEVLVRTAACGLCHSDLHVMEGKMPMPAPILLGHEASGVVEAVGSDVSEFAPGDHVVGCLNVHCDECYQCVRGRRFLCERRRTMTYRADGSSRVRRGDQQITQMSGLGGFAEQMLAHRNGLVKVPSELPLDVGALLGCAVITGVGSAFNGARVRPGQAVAVIGCGGIGLNAIQAAALVGAGRVIAVDRVPSKLELARTFGATDTVDASAGDAVGTVIEMTGGGVDHAIEAIGLKSTAEQAFAMLKMGGTATVIGMIPIGEKVEVDGFALLMEKRLQGSNMGSNRFRVDMPQYVDWYLAGKLKLDELVSATMPIEQINEGFATLRSGEVARQLITFD
jgi:S-(hydroxymethyl)glutathione dehydrogenase / alcohol dehydrogenase